MTNKEPVRKIFKCQEYMTNEQQEIAQQFQSFVESEYLLCVTEINKINQAIANNPSPNSLVWDSIASANLEFHSIQEYWQNRLNCLINFLSKRHYQLGEELANKYLKGIKIRFN